MVSVHEDSSHVRIAFATGDPDRWQRYTLASGEPVGGCEDVDVGDMNGDGLVDLLTKRGNSGRYDGVIWLQRVRTKTPGPAFHPARDHDSPELALPE